MFGSSEYLYDRFERTKTAVKQERYMIVGGVVAIIFLICLLIIFHYSGNEGKIKTNMRRKLCH